jgi:hypothetical protein
MTIGNIAANHPIECEASAGVLFDLARRIHSAWPDRSEPDRPDRHTDLSLVYTFTNLGVWAIIVALRRKDMIGEHIDEMSGLFFRHPVACHPDACVSAVTGRHSPDSRIYRKVLPVRCCD